MNLSLTAQQMCPVCGGDCASANPPMGDACPLNRTVGPTEPTVNAHDYLVAALRTIANQRSQIFTTNPQSMSANEAFAIATEALAKAGVK